MRKIALYAMAALVACAGSQSDRLGQQQQSIREARMHLQLDPSASSWTDLGDAFLSAQSLDSALYAYNKALALRQGSPGAVVGRGLVFWRQNEKKKALADFRSGLFSAQADSFTRVIASELGCPFQITKLELEGTGNAFPACSPIDNRLAFQSNRNGNWDIYIKDIQTGESNRITDNPAREGAPVFDADGTAIFFTSTRTDTVHTHIEKLKRDIFRYDLISGELTRLTDHPADEWSPRVSPDGQWLAFLSSRTESGGIDDRYCRPFILNRATGAVSAVTWEPMQYVLGGFSADGTTLAYSGKQDDYRLVQYALNSNDLPEIAVKGPVMAADWDHDGSHIVFYRYVENQLDCFMYDRRSQTLQRLTCHGSIEANPVFSHDQKMVYFHSMRNGNFEIYSIDLGSTITREALLDMLDHLSDRLD